jgi:hypothetical protein
MPRASRSSRSAAVVMEQDAEEEEDEMDKKPRARRSKTLSQQPHNKENNDNDKASPEDDDDDDDDEDAMFAFTFTSQAPELSQPIFPVRAADRGHFQRMNTEARCKAVTDLSRLILFKAMAGEPIDRLKVLKEAGLADYKISTAAFDEAARRLQHVMGLELKRPPKFMLQQTSLPAKYNDRYFVINSAMSDPVFAKHCKAIHATHVDSSIEKGLLMLVLALIFCQGEPRHDGSRWILDMDLYRLLHLVDENIPSEPPTSRTTSSNGNRRTSGSSQTQPLSASRRGRRKSNSPGDDDEEDEDEEEEDDIIGTPNVDFLLEKFVYLDYLLKERYNEEANPQRQSTANTQEGTNYFVYAMGPRAAMEVGRRQIIYFCSEVLDEEIPDSMLQEIEDDHEEEEEEDGAAGGGEAMME